MLQKLPIIKDLSPAHRSITVTVGLLMLYELARNTPLTFLFPGLETSGLETEYDLSGRLSFFTMGFLPAFSGFLFVELLSFFIPLLKTWRVGGKKGRRQLTKWSWITSLLFATISASAMIMAYRAMRLPTGEPLLGDASILHQGLMGLVLLLGFAAACGLAELISRDGIGNGFAVIMGYGILRYLPENIYETLTYSENETIPLSPKNIMTAEPPNLVGYLITIFILVVLYKKFWHRVPKFYKTLRPVILKTQARGKPIDFQLPYLPQGVIVLVWGTAFISYFVSLFQWIPGAPPSFLYSHNTWFHLLFDTLLLMGLSYLSYFLVSNPERITNNTFGKITFQDDWQYKVDLNAIRAIILAVLLWFLCHIPDVIIEGGNILYGFTILYGTTLHYGSILLETIILAALIKDVIDQYRFMKNAENPRVLETFDNVHFVTYLKGLFEAEGIRFCVQAFEYRRLFYFFEPLIKMRVLVDACDWDKARELADLENVTII